MKVRYIGKDYKVVLIPNKIYDVMEIDEETGAYRIMTEADDDGLFYKGDFEIVEE